MFKNQIVLRRLTIISILFLLVGFAPSILRSATERFPAMTDWWLTMSPSSPALLVVAEIWANLEPYLYLVRFAGAALLLASLGWALLQWYRGEGAEATADVDPVLRVSRVLLEEAEVTHGPCNDPLLIAKIDACSGTGSKEANKDTGAADPQLKDKVPPALYRWLNGLDRVALCISGGGIRSASFALGVLQAMASHPGRSRKATGATSKEHTEGRDPADDALNSYLAQIHYVSTVSGGGYIGSWLSAWLYREPFVEVWKGLVRPPSDSADPGDEPAPLQWLREHSNFLTPKLGLMSLDTLADVAIFLRNTMLNWLILLPMLCAGLLAIKLFELLVFYLSTNNNVTLFSWFAGIGFFMLFLALVFRLRNMSPILSSTGPDPTATEKPAIAAARRTADLSGVVRYGFYPSLMAAIAFTLCLALASATQAGQAYGGWVFDLLGSVMEVVKQDVVVGGVRQEVVGGVFILPKILSLGAICGALIYAFSWFASWYPGRKLGEFWRWTLSGTVYGIGVAGLVYFFSRTQAIDWSFYTPSEWVCKFSGGLFFCPETMLQGGKSRHALALLYLGVPLLLFTQLVAEMIFVGLKSDPQDDEREWLGRAAGLAILGGMSWIVVMFLSVVGSDIAVRFFANPYNWFIVAAIYAIGALAASMGRRERAPSQGQLADTATKSKAAALKTIAAVCAVALVIITSALLDMIILHQPIAGPIEGYSDPNQYGDALYAMFWPVVQALIVMVVIGVIASYSINVNRFSMHALFRNRLVRTFLGASAKNRNANPFTNFDPDDNPRMHMLWPRRTKAGPVPMPVLTKTGKWRPLHIINIALNVTSSAKRLAWQERKAASFTVSPLHSGSAYTGYRDSREYGGEDPRGRDYKNGISLGTALAISGAAASPNMGYNTSPAMAFLMTLFNVRMGWWLGNPGPEGAASYKDDGPRTAIRSLMAEMTGSTRDDSEYVYLSDGGHFDNLALYEMVRRRCGFIIISDAGCDPNFEFADLGNAVRKIQIDLGVRIIFFGLDKLKPRDPTGRGSDNGPYHAIGEINYPAADGQGVKKGIILYIKPSYHGTENSPGIRSYALSNSEFPHDSTANQWFGESQLESYRALGFEITDKILREGVNDFDALYDGIEAVGEGPGKQVTLRDVLMALDARANGRVSVRGDPPIRAPSQKMT